LINYVYINKFINELLNFLSVVLQLSMRSIPYPLPTNFSITSNDLVVAASGLKRPECVLATEDGYLHSADWRGAIAVTKSTSQLLNGDITESRKARVNGLTLWSKGGYLFADLGETEGGIFSLSKQGSIKTVVSHIDGQPIAPSNFVIEDALGRIWFTVSTRQIPRSLAWNANISDGFIGVHDEHGTRIVADGLGYTNEIAFSPDGLWVYVNETYARKISRFPLLPNANLGEKEIVATLGPGNFPDGLTFDEFGGLWVTCIVGNRILVIRPDNGAIQTVLDAADNEFVNQFEIRYQSGALTSIDTATCGKSPLGNISSLAFGGEDLKTAFLGCLLDDKIRKFSSPVAGHKPLHWHRRWDA
jgi:sugar lactone lactonase YvrE